MSIAPSNAFTPALSLTNYSLRSFSIASKSSGLHSVDSSFTSQKYLSDFQTTNPNSKNEFKGSICYRFASSEVQVPSMGESITDGVINHWKKNVGDQVNQDEVLAVIDTDKISVEVVAPVSGTIESINAIEGDTVEVGKVVCIITEGQTGGQTRKTSNPNSSTSSTEATSSSSLNSDNGSSHSSYSTSVSNPPSSSDMSIKPDSEGKKKTKEEFKQETVSVREEKRVPMTRMRLRIAERLKAAQTEAACLTTFQECDMSAVMKLRKRLGPNIQEKYNTKLGFMSFFMTACAKALEEIPMVNSAIDGKDVIMRNYVDISVAVATPNGLTVPVIRDVEKKSVVKLEQELAAMAKKARSGQISLEDMSGGTFTISNGGVYGSLMGTPILNPPQSAILGMHSIVERPVVRKGQVVTHPMMYLALTYDHRVVDGKDAVTFLKAVTEYIENPVRLLIKA